MQRNIAIGMCLLLVVGAWGITSRPAEAVSHTDPSPRTDGAVAFGMDAASIGHQSAAGVKPDYGTLWVGPWVLKNGWGNVEHQLRTMRSQGVTPAIHLYYWGNDISKSCIENGCWSSLHGVYKDKSGWQRLTQGLVDALNGQMGGKPALVFIETEFNKNDVSYYEPLDYYLAQKAGFIKKGYWNTHIVLGLGNWNQDAWKTWDRAAAASHSIGVQGMRGSTRDSWTSYHSLYESVVAGAKYAHKLFGKPIVVHDVALSTYPESTYVSAQATALKEFFTGMGTLKSAGVKALLYREWRNDPNGNLAEYYGIGERHWGLAYSGGGYKPAARVWIDGVKAERGSGTATTSTGSFSASFAPSSSVNEWWVDVTVRSSQSLSTVQVRDDGGAWVSLVKTSWGTWAKSTFIAKGSSVTFRAIGTSGEVATSGAYTWLTSGSFSASFAPASSINEWWADVAVRSDQTVAKVELRVNGGSWVPMWKTSWGTWAKSTYIPDGADVIFRATSASGAAATSGVYDWLGGGTMTASFTPSSAVNNWWVDVAVRASESLAKVELRVNDGAWIGLGKTAWGTWAKSTYVPSGAKAVFKATSTDGSTAMSGTYVW